MSQIQSIIVYRNPVEAAFWENGMVWPFMVFMFATVIWVVVLSNVATWISKRRRWPTRSSAYAWASYIAVGLGLVLAAATAWFLL